MGCQRFGGGCPRHRSVTGRLRRVLLHLDFPAMFEGTVRVWGEISIRNLAHAIPALIEPHCLKYRRSLGRCGRIR